MISATELTPKTRIWELDFLRGICVLLMVWDHFMYDIVDIFGETWITTGNQSVINFVKFAEAYEEGVLREIFHPVIYIMFFVICGISCSFSRSNLKRGIEALTLAFGITIVTAFMGTIIRFGVLHMLGVAILLWWIIDCICRHNRYITAAVSFGIGIIVLLLNQYFMTYPPKTNSDLAFIGFFFDNIKKPLYESADYFPIFPNVGYMLIGAGFGVILYDKRRSLLPQLDKYGWYKPISFWGRIALWVYVLHQIVVVIILSLISYLFITPGDFVFF